MKKTLIAALATLLLLTGCAGEEPPEMVTVPAVVGLTEGGVLNALMNAHLKIDWDPAEVAKTPTTEDGWIAVAQTQSAGSEVEEMSAVTVRFERITEPPASEPTETAEPEPQTSAEPTPEASAGEPTAPRGLLAEVEAAFTSSYGSGDDATYPVILSFSGIDAPRITVAVDMYPKAENEPEALGVCRAVLSIRDQVTSPFRGVYVTAGEGGPFLAECDNPDY